MLGGLFPPQEHETDEQRWGDHLDVVQQTSQMHRAIFDRRRQRRRFAGSAEREGSLK